MKLSQAAKILETTLQGTDAEFNGASIDSRSLQAGNLFFAFPGEHSNAGRSAEP